MNNDLLTGFDYKKSAALKRTDGEGEFEIVEMEWGILPGYIRIQKVHKTSDRTTRKAVWIFFSPGFESGKKNTQQPPTRKKRSVGKTMTGTAYGFGVSYLPGGVFFNR